MKIAILILGHLRAWEVCRENFLNTLYDETHQIDVFLDTYNRIFRSDYELYGENQIDFVLSDDAILKLFDNINVVDFKVEPELVGDSEGLQIRKILRVVKSYEEYEKIHGKYDLVVRTRFDLLLDKKIDYDYLLEGIKKNPKIIHIGNGSIDMEENDMFAVCDSDTFKIYGNRFLEINGRDDYNLLLELCGKRFFEIPFIHGSLILIKSLYGLKYIQDIGISVVRLNGNKQYKVFK